MTIEINDQCKIQGIQEEFSAAFPYLKLEFFATTRVSSSSAPQKTVRNGSRTIGECRTVHNGEQISISPAMTVTELEKKFSDVYGLRVRLLRKSGKSWLDTNVTDSWSLAMQNSEGEAITKLIN